MRGLALIHLAQGSSDRAEAYAHQALAIAETDARYATNVAYSLDALAQIYRYRGKHVEAEAFWKRSLTILQEKLGPNHADVGLSLSALATLYSGQARFSEAEPLFKRALAVLENAFGSRHQQLVSALEGYAALMRATGRDAEATVLQARATEIRAARSDRAR